MEMERKKDSHFLQNISTKRRDEAYHHWIDRLMVTFIIVQFAEYFHISQFKCHFKLRVYGSVSVRCLHRFLSFFHLLPLTVEQNINKYSSTVLALSLKIYYEEHFLQLNGWPINMGFNDNGLQLTYNLYVMCMCVLRHRIDTIRSVNPRCLYCTSELL